MSKEKTKVEPKAVKLFREKTEASMAKIKKIEEFRESDEHIDYVFKVGEWLFQQNLDQMAEGTLLRIGGKLNGVYAYLGNQSSYARAERDVYEAKRDEVLNELTVDYYSGSDDKISYARARAKKETAELTDFVIEKEHQKNNLEHLVEACRTMIMYTQSTLSSKKNERYVSKQMHDNA